MPECVDRLVECGSEMKFLAFYLGNHDSNVADVASITHRERLRVTRQSLPHLFRGLLHSVVGSVSMTRSASRITCHN